MAAPYNPPNRGQDFLIYIGLQDANDSRRYKASPTIAAGDFKIKKDNGTPADLATTPTVENTYYVRVYLSATEMTADTVTIMWRDTDEPPQWVDGLMCIPTTTP